jgi:hypothetical protein
VESAVPADSEHFDVIGVDEHDDGICVHPLSDADDEDIFTKTRSKIEYRILIEQQSQTNERNRKVNLFFVWFVLLSCMFVCRVLIV